MSQPSRSRIKIQVQDQRLVAAASDFRRRTLGWARACVRFPRKLLSAVFPQQERAVPFSILPGYGAELDLLIDAPGCRSVTLFAEAKTVLGETDIQLSEAQTVPLNENGRGTATITATPRDDKVTGQAAVRLVLVDPLRPDDLLAENSRLSLSQEGTSALITSLLILLLGIGFSIQVLLGGWPILALMITLALGFMYYNAAPIKRARFEPRRLLLVRTRWRAVALICVGLAGWSSLMYANIMLDNGNFPCANDADTAMTVVGDNLSSILASLIFFFCLMAALAPAVRPAALVGQITIVAALAPLFLYDLTVVPSLIFNDSAAYACVYTRRFLLLYPAIGWIFGILVALFYIYRLRPDARGAMFHVLAFIGLSALSLKFLPFVEQRPLAVGLWAWICLRPLVAPIPRRRLMVGSILMAIAFAGTYIFFGLIQERFTTVADVTYRSLWWEDLYRTNHYRHFLVLVTGISLPIMVILACVEVGLWQRKRRLQRLGRVTPEMKR